MDEPLQAAARWHWLPDEKEHHINWKELSTPLMGLQSLDLEFPGLVLNAMVRDRCDNSVSVSYINRQGGRIPELSFVAEALSSHPHAQQDRSNLSRAGRRGGRDQLYGDS